MSDTEQQRGWTKAELAHFFETVQTNLALLSSCRDAGTPAPQDIWVKAAAMLGSKTAEQLEALYNRQSTLLHVPGVTKEIFLASVADLLKVVETASPKLDLSSDSLVQAIALSEPHVDDKDAADSATKPSNVLDSPTADEASSPRQVPRTGLDISSRGKPRRLSDEFMPEEGAEEGVAELLALIMSPPKPGAASGRLPGHDQSSLTSDENSESSELESDNDTAETSCQNELQKYLVSAQSNRKFLMWCMYEWFYPNIDMPWYMQNEFQGCLNALNLGHITAGTRAQWSHIRATLGRPRRFSPQFLAEQREELAAARVKLRQEATSPGWIGAAGLPPASIVLNPNERCVVYHQQTGQMFKGVLQDQLANGMFSVAFDPMPTSRSAPPAPVFGYVPDNHIMSLRYNVATIERLTRPAVPVKRGPAPQPVLYSPTPGTHPSSATAHGVAVKNESDSSVSYYHPRRPDSKQNSGSHKRPVGRPPNHAKASNYSIELYSSDSDSEAFRNAPSHFLMRAPPTHVYSEEDVALSARVFTLLNAKETILQDLYMINGETDRVLGSLGPDDSPEESIPDELRRAYTWLINKLSVVSERLEKELEKLQARQASLEQSHPYLSSQLMNELSAQQRPLLAGGIFSNWYMEMGLACRRQAAQIVGSSEHDSEGLDLKKMVLNAVNMIIHLTSCRKLPLSNEQVALAIDAAFSQMRPKFAQNHAVYAQLRDVVAAYQSKISNAVGGTNPGQKP